MSGAAPGDASSSPIAATRAARSWSAASRRRPASTSVRARSVSSSQASGTVAAAEHRGEALLRAQRGAAAPARPVGGRDVDRFAPAPVGHLLAAAVADAHHDRPVARDLADGGVGGGDAVGVERRG